MIDHALLRPDTPEKTHRAGHSLASSLYVPAAPLLCDGDLGAGKSTFIRGLAEGLGVRGHVTSPTYALEQRYASNKGTFTHIDLYRLDSAQARAFLRGVEHENGVLCIEWAKRTEDDWCGPAVRARFSEHGAGREIHIEFDDVSLPSRAEIEAWRTDVHLSDNVIAHCEAVAGLAARIAEHLLARGIVIRPLAVRRAAELHDLLRFVDFRPGASPDAFRPTPAQERRWQEIKIQRPGRTHEDACADFLEERGYPELGRIVRPHGMHLPSPDRVTIEQQVLYYADKRVAMDRVVSLEERFADFARRYGDGVQTKTAKIWYEEAKTMESLLFPDGPVS